MARTLKVTSRNAQFQQWQALLANRAKRQRAGEFLVQGVRPVTLAVEHGWPVRALLHPDGGGLSRWARDLLAGAAASGPSPARFAVAPELLAELGGKEDGVPELLAVVGLPPDDLDRIPARAGMLAVVFDRPTAPGNIGTLIRSVDAFGASGMVITGHAADPYDPRAVRASTGSLFAVPVARVGSRADVLSWVDRLRGRGIPVRIVGTDEHGEVDIADCDLTGGTLLLVGNETHGLSHGWRQDCHQVARIPIGGAASSLNAAAAGTVVLYEAARQRRAARAPRGGRVGAPRGADSMW